jgi:hypothetical protein
MAQILKVCTLCQVETPIDETVLAPRRRRDIPYRKRVCLCCVEALRDELQATRTQREPGQDE